MDENYEIIGERTECYVDIYEAYMAIKEQGMLIYMKITRTKN
jgi:hypothetical protein